MYKRQIENEELIIDGESVYVLNGSKPTWDELETQLDIEREEYAPEIMEYVAVNEYLARELSDRGEAITRHVFGLTVWSRTTTGQSVYMDEVIRDIVRG